VFRSKLGLHRDAVARDMRRPLATLITEKARALTQAFLPPKVRSSDCCGCGRDRRRGAASAARSGRSNIFVIRLVGGSRTIANNEVQVYTLLSTLIEACASKRARVGYLERGAIRCVTIVCTL
jgi:hypothetical protein